MAIEALKPDSLLARDTMPGRRSLFMGLSPTATAIVLPHQPSNAEVLETRGYEMFPQSLPPLPPFSQHMATVAKHEITLTLRAADGQLYTAVLQAESAPGFDGYYNAHVRELPGCITYGEDLRRAVDNLREALSLYLESE